MSDEWGDRLDADIRAVLDGPGTVEDAIKNIEARKERERQGRAFEQQMLGCARTFVSGTCPAFGDMAPEEQQNYHACRRGEHEREMSGYPGYE